MKIRINWKNEIAYLYLSNIPSALTATLNGFHQNFYYNKNIISTVPPFFFFFLNSKVLHFQREDVVKFDKGKNKSTMLKPFLCALLAIIV